MGLPEKMALGLWMHSLSAVSLPKSFFKTWKAELMAGDREPVLCASLAIT